MRRLGITLGTLLLLAGCGPARRTVRSEADTACTTAVAAHTETVAVQTAQTIAETVEAVDRETVTEIVEFDTALPIDPATGSPPVKRKVRQVARSALRSKQSAATATETGTATETDRAAETTEHTTHSTTERSRRGMNGLQRILCTAGLMLVAGLALRWAIRRLKQ